jgi:predicted nuclease with TOPRIM domain
MRRICLFLSFVILAGCVSTKETKELEDLKQENNRLQGDNSRLQTENEDLKKQTPMSEALLKSDKLYIVVINDLQQEKAALQTKNTDLQARNQTMQSDLARLQSENQKVKTDSIQEISRLQRKITELEAQLGASSR